jgi:hypothetical protein
LYLDGKTHAFHGDGSETGNKCNQCLQLRAGGAGCSCGVDVGHAGTGKKVVDVGVNFDVQSGGRGRHLKETSGRSWNIGCTGERFRGIDEI